MVLEEVFQVAFRSLNWLFVKSIISEGYEKTCNKVEREKKQFML